MSGETEILGNPPTMNNNKKKPPLAEEERKQIIAELLVGCTWHNEMPKLAHKAMSKVATNSRNTIFNNFLGVGARQRKLRTIWKVHSISLKESWKVRSLQSILGPQSHGRGAQGKDGRGVCSLSVALGIPATTIQSSFQAALTKEHITARAFCTRSKLDRSADLHDG
jgi:hypothetical protein